MNTALEIPVMATNELQTTTPLDMDVFLFEQEEQRESNTQYYLHPNQEEKEVANRLVEQAKTDPVVLQLRRPSLKADDRETLLHSDGVALAAVVIGKRLGCSEKELEYIAAAGLVHDVGKAADPEIQDLVLSPRMFTDEEHEKLALHPFLSAEKILETTGWPDEKLKAVHDISLAHHAYKKIRHYGQRPSGNQVPAMAMALADLLDSLSSARSYRPYALSWPAARAVIDEEFDANKEFIDKGLGKGPKLGRFSRDIGQKTLELATV